MKREILQEPCHYEYFPITNQIYLILRKLLTIQLSRARLEIKSLQIKVALQYSHLITISFIQILELSLHDCSQPHFPSTVPWDEFFNYKNFRSTVQNTGSPVFLVYWPLRLSSSSRPESLDSSICDVIALDGLEAQAATRVDSILSEAGSRALKISLSKPLTLSVTQNTIGWNSSYILIKLQCQNTMSCF